MNIKQVDGLTHVPFMGESFLDFVLNIFWRILNMHCTYVHCTLYICTMYICIDYSNMSAMNITSS